MDIRIGKPSRTCFVTEREFEHGEKVTSVVRLRDEHYEREDYSDEGWDDSRAEGAIAVWITTYHDPRVEEEESPESFSPLRQLFYEAVESQDRKELAKAYLAAELLRRQKVFKLLKHSDTSGDDEVSVALYNDRIGNRLVEVRDPSLSLDEMEEGRLALIERLRELEAPDEEEDDEDATDEVEDEIFDEDEEEELVDDEDEVLDEEDDDPDEPVDPAGEVEADAEAQEV